MEGQPRRAAISVDDEAPVGGADRTSVCRSAESRTGRAARIKWQARVDLNEAFIGERLHEGEEAANAEANSFRCDCRISTDAIGT